MSTVLLAALVAPRVNFSPLRYVGNPLENGIDTPPVMVVDAEKVKACVRSSQLCMIFPFEPPTGMQNHTVEQSVPGVDVATRLGMTKGAPAVDEAVDTPT